MYVIKVGEYYLAPVLKAELDKEDYPTLIKDRDSAWRLEDRELAEAWSNLLDALVITIE
jgi:hypothetical protein